MTKILLLLMFLSSFTSFAKDSKPSVQKKMDKRSQEEKEQDVLDFSNIKSVIQSDGLSAQKRMNEVYAKKISKERKSIKYGRYQYPNEGDFWSILSELWLVKNAQKLNWDFPKPDYGIGPAFRSLLEKLGYFNKRIKILIVNTSTISHFALPGRNGEYLFIVSLPFIRNMDLTKVDISLILLEDFFRSELGSFRANLNIDLKFLGTNFYESKMDKTIVKRTLARYSEVIFNSGFNFQQQFELTKKMDQLLKVDPVLWGAYYKLIGKIDRYVKNDILYKTYLKIYPSPELQLKWLSPVKKAL